jgi:catechol 2,3-dioxygenase-like lactoylglutathione lyase family enzyme
MFTGIDEISFGVEDLGTASRFLEQWGLKRQSSQAECWETRDGGIVSVRSAEEASAREAGGKGVGVHELVWGVSDQSALDEIASRLGGHSWPFERAADGALELRDPAGTQLRIRTTRRRPVIVGQTPVNTPSSAQRIDRPGTFYKGAQPVQIGHAVFVVPDLQATVKFYTEVLGFHVSDLYKGRGYFLRCRLEGEHHHLFLLNGNGEPTRFHHLAFLVSEIHEVFGGGLKVQGDGWPTQIGPGRHPVSSVYFWYFQSPIAGGAFEYYADSDYVTGNWKPRELEQTPEWFTEWSLKDGLPKYDDVQKR